MPLASLTTFFENMTPESLKRFPEYYCQDAYFKDPFHEVTRVADIQAIFAKMFQQVDVPRFVVIDQLRDGDAAFLVWEFHFRFKGRQPSAMQVLRGVSHLKFSNDGRVAFHRDYWDPVEELYAKLPYFGRFIRWVQSRV